MALLKRIHFYPTNSFLQLCLLKGKIHLIRCNIKICWWDIVILFSKQSCQAPLEDSAIVIVADTITETIPLCNHTMVVSDNVSRFRAELAVFRIFEPASTELSDCFLSILFHFVILPFFFVLCYTLCLQQVSEEQSNCKSAVVKNGTHAYLPSLPPSHPLLREVPCYISMHFYFSCHQYL